MILRCCAEQLLFSTTSQYHSGGIVNVKLSDNINFKYVRLLSDN